MKNFPLNAGKEEKTRLRPPWGRVPKCPLFLASEGAHTLLPSVRELPGCPRSRLLRPAVPLAGLPSLLPFAHAPHSLAMRGSQGQRPVPETL